MDEGVTWVSVHHGGGVGLGYSFYMQEWLLWQTVRKKQSHALNLVLTTASYRV
ncbi:urocanate hydratase [Peribacillus sp. B2I2]